MRKYAIPSDPRGLIFEAYRIDGITSEDCRSIFFDWALGLNDDLNLMDELTSLYNLYSQKNPNHPMSLVLKEGLSNSSRKIIRRRGRKKQNGTQE